MGILKRNKNGKWNVEGSTKYVVYKRVIDLTKEDLTVLQQYNLKNYVYIYIGQCGESEIDNRHSKIRWDVLNRFTGNKHVHINPDTARTYQNIMRFLREQKGMTQKEAEDYLFRSKECFKIYKEELSEEESLIEEKRLYHSYMVASKLTNIGLLPNRDSQVYETENAIKLKKTRKNEDFVSARITIEGNTKTNECFLVIDDIRIDIKLSKSDLDFIEKILVPQEVM